MNKVFSFISGATIGALIGSLAAILFTPSSGESLRTDMRSQIDRVVGDIRSSVETERKRLEEELAALKKGEIKVA
ncbi:MAG: YtxH domain-containing protein [Anaerolineae bacterium]|nr:YtxH domain-containing protein [Anaerolineae bacterium]